MKSAPAKLQVRIDPDPKAADDEVFMEIGLDANTAIRLFYTKVAQTRSIPFELSALPEFSPEAEARIMEAWEESMNPANLIGPFASAEELVAFLHQQPDDDADDDVIVAN